MDRNTILAIVLTVIVIVVGMTIQTAFISAENDVNGQALNSTVEVVEEKDNASLLPAVTSFTSFEAENKATDASPFTVETEAMRITFDPAGASVSSLKLRKHLETGSDEPLEVIVKDEIGKNAFLLYFDDDFSNPVTDCFNYTIEETEDLKLVNFTQTFNMNDRKFTVTKRYAIPQREEYLFQIAVGISANDGLELPFNTYTLGYDPQVGPYFESLNGNYDYRRAYYMLSDKNSKKTVNFKTNPVYMEDPVDWVATAGKYFNVIGLPPTGVDTKVAFTQASHDERLAQSNSFYFIREGISGSSIVDVYSFYAGPRTTQYLNIYDLEKDNTFGLSNLKLNKAMDTSSWLGWLETILKWLLNFFYRLVPNYGVDIVLVTILIKLLLQPLSKKGQESTAKMSALNPQIQEIQERYSDNPEAMNAAMSKLYKEEGINPMGSCLPMLIQFPIFIALYGLLNNHYELRGAMFIPGWIPDLSVPDTIFTLPFRIPILGNQVHLLPILYTVSMIFSMKITQTSSTQSSGNNSMMAFMNYGMPIIFFFVLYNAPSGLLVYWSVTNAISIFQQIYINRKNKKKFDEEQKVKAEEEAEKLKFKKRKKK